MKPYDFYKDKFKLKDPEKERIQKYNEKDNYDFPFFAGKDSDGKKLNMTVLNNANESQPTDFAIYRVQRKALEQVFQKIYSNLGDDAQYVAKFIRSAGKQTKKMLKKYSKLKRDQTEFNKMIKDLKDKY